MSETKGGLQHLWITTSKKTQLCGFFFFLSLTWGNRKGKSRLKQRERGKPREDNLEEPQCLDGGDSVVKRCTATLTVYRGEAATGVPG